MKIVVQQANPPQALRLLLQADDDADGIDVALSAAGVWAGKKPVLVINGTGKDLSAFAKRHHFGVLCDDAGRPTRSITEIAEVLETLERERFGAVVFLDTNRLWRGIRCAVKHIEDIKNLNPGHWDDTAEAIFECMEALTRLGLPSLFLAPASDVNGLDENGESAVVGTKPQAWKDLGRQAHALLKLSRRGRALEVEVAGDDWRKLGQVGEVVRISGAELGMRFAELAQGRAGEATGTTLAEATAAELAARTRRAERRRAESEGARDRLSQLSQLRAYQGPEAWARHVEEVAMAASSMAPEDAEMLHQRVGHAYTQMASDLEWMRAAEKTLELSPFSLHKSARWHICGPSIAECPARDDIPVGELAPEKLASLASECAPEDLPMWVASLARYAGVWSEPSFAVVCKANGLTPKGAVWERYSDGELRALVTGLLWLASLRRQFDPPQSERRARPVPVLVETPAAVEEDEPIWNGETWEPADAAVAENEAIADTENPNADLDRLETFINRSAVGQGITIERSATGAANGVPVVLPDPATFVVLSEPVQRDTLNFALGLVGARDNWDSFRRGTSIGSSKSDRMWGADERAEIYRTALAKLRDSSSREAA